MWNDSTRIGTQNTFGRSSRTGKRDIEALQKTKDNMLEGKFCLFLNFYWWSIFIKTINLFPPRSLSLPVIPPHSLSFPIIPPCSLSFPLSPCHSLSFPIIPPCSPHSPLFPLTPRHSPLLSVIPPHSPHSPSFPLTPRHSPLPPLTLWGQEGSDRGEGMLY